MDFFEAQDNARRSTRRLVVAFIFATLCTVVAINVVALGVTFVAVTGQTEGGVPPEQFEWFRPGLLAAVSLVTLGVIFGASAFKTLQIHGDGGKVARMLGGRLVDTHTPDDNERKLLNLVEEMSIASGMPVPDVYVIDREPGINAFAAGTSVDTAAVGFTRGCIENLDRDELQGVVAHEFSHILNGDMKLNIRLIGVVFGILVVGLIGYTCFRYAPYMMHASRGSSRNNQGGAAFGLVLLLAGGLIWLIGSIGTFFGRWIQASISRQREFLADAAAVQFTRNHTGIRDALRKIGGASGKLQNAHAGEVSHMFFANGFDGMFRTHPPLENRIKALDKTWDGSFLKPQTPGGGRANASGPSDTKPARDARSRFPVLGDVLGPHTRPHTGAHAGVPGLPGATTGLAGPPAPRRVSTKGITQAAGTLDQEHIDFAHAVVETLPRPLVDAAHDPDRAPGLVYCFFLHEDEGVRTLQEEILAQRDPQSAGGVTDLLPLVRRLGPAGRLPLVEIALPSLRRLDRADARRLLDVLRLLVNADRRVAPFEYALFKIVQKHAGGVRPVASRFTSLSSVRDAAGTTLSALAAAGSPDDPKAAADAYVAGVRRLQIDAPPFDPAFKLPDLDAALDKLARTTPGVKRRLLDAASTVVSAGGRVTVPEAELLRAVAAVLDVPLPPFLTPAGAAAPAPGSPAPAPGSPAPAPGSPAPARKSAAPA